MDRGAWWPVHEVAKLDTTEVTSHTCMHVYLIAILNNRVRLIAVTIILLPFCHLIQNRFNRKKMKMKAKYL